MQPELRTADLVLRSRLGVVSLKGSKCWIIEKTREFQKNIFLCFIDYVKAFVWITINCGKFFKRWEYQTT